MQCSALRFPHRCGMCISNPAFTFVCIFVIRTARYGTGFWIWHPSCGSVETPRTPAPQLAGIHYSYLRYKQEKVA